MPLIKLVTKIIFGALFIVAGANHFINPKFYLAIMPPYMPWHFALVVISGIAEVVLGIGLLIPKTSEYAAWGLIALLIAVFPANVHMVMHPELYPTIAPLALWLRIPLQGVLVAWAYWYTFAKNVPR